MTAKLINGKSSLERIVSLEVNNSTAELFIQNSDGSIKSEFVPNHFWILSDQQHGKDWIRLKGDLHYKYGRQFQDKKDFYSVKQSLRHEDIFLINDQKESFMLNKGYTYFKGLKLEDVSILSFDIETTGLEHNDSSKVLLISNTFRNNGIIERKLFAYDDYNDEGEMINTWCKWVREKNPSVLAGHNINLFDLPYLNFIANKYDTKLYLGRNNSPLKFNTYESKFRKDSTQDYHYYKAKIYGREIVDTMFLSIKYDVARKYESYGLKSIIKYEGLEIKDRVFYDASKIRFNYTNKIEWAKIKEYAMHDADDSLALFDLMAAPLFYSTQMVPKSFQLVTESAEGSKINSIMIRAYLQDGHSLPKESERVDFVGAISYGSPGIYRNCWSVDVASLYPSIIIQYEVYDKDKDPNKYFLELVRTLTDERLKNKALAKETGDSYYKHLEQSQKVTINSCYGFLGSTGLLFNSPKLAAFVTEKGREILKSAIKWATGKEYEEWNIQNK